MEKPSNSIINYPRQTIRTYRLILSRFYRIIVALVAKVGIDEYEYICTNISPCFIVRGQNPKRFRDSEESNPTPIPASPLTTTTTTSSYDTVSPAPKRRAPLSVIVKQEPNKSDTEKRKKPRTTPKFEVTEVDDDVKWATQPAPETVSLLWPCIPFLLSLTRTDLC